MFNDMICNQKNIIYETVEKSTLLTPYIYDVKIKFVIKIENISNTFPSFSSPTSCKLSV